MDLKNNTINLVNNLDKPVDNQTEQYMCDVCGNNYAYSSGLSQHKKKCKGRIITEDEYKKSEEDRLVAIEKLIIAENKYKKSEEDGLAIADKLKISEKKVSEMTVKLSAMLDDNKVKNADAQDNKKRCNYCNSVFTSSANLSNHAKVCGKKAESDKLIVDQKILIEKLTTDHKTQIEKLTADHKIQIEKLTADHKTQMDDLNKRTDQIVNLASTSANIASTSTNMASTSMSVSMSAWRYLNTYCKDSPELQSIPNMSAITNDYEDDKKFSYELISAYRNNNLKVFITDIIVNEYKKDDPHDQSIWNSDVARMIYYVQQTVKDGKKWFTDKNGIQVTNIVIQPVLAHIKKMLQEFIKILCIDIASIRDRPRRQVELTEFQKFANQIISIIDNKVLEKEILKEMAPFFSWSKKTASETPRIELIEEKKDVKLIEHKKEGGIVIEEVDDEEEVVIDKDLTNIFAFFKNIKSKTAKKPTTPPITPTPTPLTTTTTKVATKAPAQKTLKTSTPPAKSRVFKKPSKADLENKISLTDSEDDIVDNNAYNDDSDSD